VGEGFGLSEGVVGSVLAAVGTALPETLLPLVAILSGHEAGEEIGIGAILGAPFMLTTLAMVVIAVAVLFYARGGVGYAKFYPTELLSPDALLFAGPGIEYFTRIRHFSVGFEVTGSYLVKSKTFGFALAPNLRYAF